MLKHLGFPSHAFAHWRVFAPAAPRGAGTCISVSLWRLPLSRPLLIFGLVVRYTANNLISRRLILELKFKEAVVPESLPYQVFVSVFRAYP